MGHYRSFIGHSIAEALSFVKESVFTEEYSASKGFLQARDPRYKTASILLLLCAVLFCRDMYVLIGIYAFCLLLARASSIDLWFFLKRTWVFIPLFSFFITVPALFDIVTPGEPVLALKIFNYPLNITKQGIFGAGFFLTRVVASVSLSMLLVLTTKHTVLLKVLGIFKVPVIFVMTIGMCYRYVYLFIEILQYTYLSIKSRVGFAVQHNRGRQIVAWNIASLWQRSYHLNNQVYHAMLSRGYKGQPQVLEDFRTGIIDVVMLAGVGLFFLFVLISKAGV